MKRLILSFACVLMVGMAQAFTFKGTVYDEKSAPLPFVTVYVEDLGVCVMTNRTGEFFIADLPEGEHRIMVSRLGYKTQFHTYSLEKDECVQMDMFPYNLSFDYLPETGRNESPLIHILNNVVNYNSTRYKHLKSYKCEYATHYEQTKQYKIDDATAKFIDFNERVMSIIGCIPEVGIVHSASRFSDMAIDFAMNVERSSMKNNTKDARIIYCNHLLIGYENRSWVKHMSRSVDMDNYYYQFEKFKKSASKLAKKGKSADILPGEYKSGERTYEKLSYLGAYTEGNSVIHVIGIENLGVKREDGSFKEVFGCVTKVFCHIEDKSWQIRRLVECESQSHGPSTVVEFAKLSADLYFPISEYDNICIVPPKSDANAIPFGCPSCIPTTSCIFYNEIILRKVK